MKKRFVCGAFQSSHKSKYHISKESLLPWLHKYLLFVSVLAAEVVDTSNISDVVFPARPDQLGNFSSSMTNEIAQITIPGTSLARLSDQSNQTGKFVIVIS